MHPLMFWLYHKYSNLLCLFLYFHSLSAQVSAKVDYAWEPFALSDVTLGDGCFRQAMDHHAEYVLLQSEFDKKYADYQTVAADPSTPEAIKERRVQELQESDKKIREFQRRAADDIASRREALSNPINEKIQTAIQAAGRQANLDVVFDTAVTPVAYTGPNTVDITPMVKTILGL